MPDAFGPIRWFDWDAVERHYGGNLPHFELPGGIYFVTFRLADSLPQDVYKKLAATRDAFLAHNPLPHTPEQQDQFKRIYHLPLERNLDRGLGECVLRNRCVRDLLKDILLHHDRNPYQIGDFVIMPNHVHLVARTRRGLKLRNICRQWKSLSANRIHNLLHREGRLWQTEPFDHIIRSPLKLEKCRRYIRDNPRNLKPTDYLLSEGTLFKSPAQ